MKHIFVINPSAGHKKNFANKLKSKLTQALTELSVDFEIIIPEVCGAARARIKELSSDTGETLRVYACGGDGTLSEIVNTIVGIPNTECALFPAGTGNDFSRNFSNPENFFDIKKQINGRSTPIDTIVCNGRHSINMINIGFDCDVVDAADRLKQKTPLSGSAAYLGGVFTTLFRHYGTKMHYTFPDGTTEDGEFLLSAFGNGGYCGGGFFSHPRVVLNDGLLDLCIVKKVSRPTFLRLLPLYKKGKHLESRRAADIILYRQLTGISVTFDKEIGICIDGDIVYNDHADIAIAEKSVRFSVPEGSVLTASLSIPASV